MLRIVDSMGDLNFGELMQVYIEGNVENGAMRYPDLDGNVQLIEAEQDFFCFLQTFFKTPGSFCAVWVSDKHYKAALRIEPYKDGVRLEALETAPDCRRQGYGKALVDSVLQYLATKDVHRVYSHVSVKNVPSRRLHQACGFIELKEHAEFIDGSVHSSFLTLLKEVKPSG